MILPCLVWTKSLSNTRNCQLNDLNLFGRHQLAWEAEGECWHRVPCSFRHGVQARTAPSPCVLHWRSPRPARGRLGVGALPAPRPLSGLAAGSSWPRWCPRPAATPTRRMMASATVSCRVLLARLLTLLPVCNLVDLVFCYHSQCHENGDACLTTSHA